MKKLSFIIAMLLALSFALVGCGGTVDEGNPDEGNADEISITVKVIVDEKETVFEYKTTKEFLDEVLLDEKLVVGDKSEWGLFVHTVNGLKAVEDNDEWWCLTKAGDAVMTGISMTSVSDGDVFELTFTVGF